MGRGSNHLAAGAVAALALPVEVLALGLPLVLAIPAAALIYAGTALALAPRGRRLAIDDAKIDRAQAQVARELIDEAEATVERLRAAGRRLRAVEDRQRVERLAGSAQTILDRLAAAPEKLPAVRRFLAYYLPRSADLAEGLATLERQVAPDPARRSRFDATLDRLADAFDSYADNLDRVDLEGLDVEMKLIDRALAEDLGPAAVGGSR